MDSNFSPKVKEIISYSREEALRLGNDFIGTEHLLLGLIREGESMAMRILQTLQIDLFDLRKEVEVVIKDKNNRTVTTPQQSASNPAGGKSNTHYGAGSKNAEKPYCGV